jgi:uncharacterized membrane protein
MDPSGFPTDFSTDIPTPDRVVSTGLGIMGVFFALFWILFIAAVIFILYTATRRYRAAKDAGLDPFAGDIQVMGQVKDSALLAPEHSVEERLAEIDALRAAGTITAEEHEAARARIIAAL